LYASETIAGHMSWHAEAKLEDGNMSHPRDCEILQYFERTHPDFSKEMRNVRLGLYTDGFPLFRMPGKYYSCWPVIFTLYNLLVVVHERSYDVFYNYYAGIEES
jgi:hypothetical protein